MHLGRCQKGLLIMCEKYAIIKCMFNVKVVSVTTALLYRFKQLWFNNCFSSSKLIEWLAINPLVEERVEHWKYTKKIELRLLWFSFVSNASLLFPTGNFPCNHAFPTPEVSKVFLTFPHPLQKINDLGSTTNKRENCLHSLTSQKQQKNVDKICSCEFYHVER